MVNVLKGVYGETKKKMTNNKHNYRGKPWLAKACMIFGEISLDADTHTIRMTHVQRNMRMPVSFFKSTTGR